MKKLFILFCIAVIFTNQSLVKSEDCTLPCDPVNLELNLSDCQPCEPIGCSQFETEICIADKFFNKRRKNCNWLLSEFEVNGWIQGGFFANAQGTTTKRSKQRNYDNKLVTQFDPQSGNGFFFGNTHSTDFQINQLWVELTKEANGSHGLDWGFNAGVLFGTDAWFTQSFSDAKFDYGWQKGDYFTSIPTLYFQLAYGDVSLKVGKFETYIGYESLRAPTAIFYSHPYSFMIEPATHSGLLVEYTPTDKLQIVLAYTTGADASLENKYDDHGFIVSTSYQLTDKLNLTYSLMHQRYGGGVYENGDPRSFANSNQFFHTFLASYDISKKLSYVLQWTYCDVKNRLQFSHDRSKGIGNYLKYKLDQFWSVGFRAEWFVTGGVDYSEYTLGLTWQPYENFIVRPEIRFDHASDKINKPFNYGKNRDQLSGGITGVYVF
jgi:hypothetical protein